MTTQTPHHLRDPGPRMPLGNEPASVTRPILDDYAARQHVTATASPEVSRETSFILSEELGWRNLVRCPLPVAGFVKLGAYARTAFEANLCARFGGFTAHDARGGWRDDDGQLIIEPVTVYEVSVTRGNGETDAVRQTFLRMGHALGEIAVHVEVHGYDAAHAYVNLPEPERKRGAIQAELDAATARRAKYNRPWPTA